MSETEVWKVIEEFPNYSISTLGRVRNDRIKRIRNPEPTPYGYVCVSLKKDGKTRRRFIHRLMALAFIPNPENKPSVDHINRIKSDNRLENLRWATVSENGLNIDVLKRNKLQEKNIFFDKCHSGKKYCVSQTLEGVMRKAYFETLEEAKLFRDGLEDFYS